MTTEPQRGDAYSLEDIVMWVETVSDEDNLISLRTHHDRVVVVPRSMFDRYFLRLRIPSDERDRYRQALERIYQRAKGDVLEIAREALNAA